MFFKLINGLTRQYSLISLWQTNSLYTLRNTATDLKTPQKSSSIGQKSSSYRDARLWNSLPGQSKRAADLMSFKKVLLTLISNNDGH